jgi:peptidoglycan/xylan/chitin deacetylase (PgdA/CDA1 family)
MRLVKPPYLLRKMLPRLIWRFSVKEKIIFLTFDDGPIPELTPWVLDTLKVYQAKATFFCVGENVVKHPKIFKRLSDEGHATGNHTFNHLNGWQTDNKAYFENIKKCSPLIKSNLFRPPYGKIKRSQLYSSFFKENFKVVLWDVLSYDFDGMVSPEKCLSNVLKNVKPGSVVVFHDNLKAEKNIKYALPKVLETLSSMGFRFEAIKL